MRVGFLGLGRMGSALARNLAEAGHELTVWNRTRAVAERFAAETAATVADSPAQLAAGVEVTMSMLADDRAVEEVFLGSGGILEGLPAGSVAVDHSTVAPATARRLAGEVARRGSAFVEAPVSGSTATVASRKLVVMAGGDADAVARVRPLLEVSAAAVHHLGPAGTGAAMKLTINSIVYGLNAAISEALVLAERCGIDRRAAYEVIAGSAIAAPMVHYRRGQYEHPSAEDVSFRLALGVKDLRLITELAKDVGAPMALAARNLEVHAAAADGGFADWDLAAVAEHLRRSAGSHG